MAPIIIEGSSSKFNEIVSETCPVNAYWRCGVLGRDLSGLRELSSKDTCNRHPSPARLSKLNCSLRSLQVRTLSTRTFIRTVWVLIAITMIGPATWFIVDPILRRHPGVELPMIVVAPFALFNFLLYALGKVLCAILAIFSVIVLFLREIPFTTRLITTIIGALTCSTLLYWATLVRHSW
jgi:hypothetical protein